MSLALQRSRRPQDRRSPRRSPASLISGSGMNSASGFRDSSTGWRLKPFVQLAVEGIDGGFFLVLRGDGREGLRFSPSAATVRTSRPR